VGNKLAGIANAAIDISDGLLADLQHILVSSKVGATLFPEKLPLSEEMQQLSVEKARQFALSGGDDYELCITVSPDKEQEVYMALKQVECQYTCIGVIQAKEGLYLETSAGIELANIVGYEHFK
jgi:thiamine-monophosphate kinase